MQKQYLLTFNITICKISIYCITDMFFYCYFILNINITNSMVVIYLSEYIFNFLIKGVSISCLLGIKF